MKSTGTLGTADVGLRAAAQIAELGMNYIRQVINNRLPSSIVSQVLLYEFSSLPLV